ncbi:succinate dehydrogenase assembly factor 2 [Halocynthiibacter sp.]|uniref:FAD assembly factor SdhE n=1 Tax=Halocynthiibacter sp. TaxID=1979210 RepID=UPI003C409395
MTESKEHRLKRLHMRSIRRGIKEMDIILSGFSAAALQDLSAAELDLYEALLEENDHDLYGWVSGQLATPGHYLELITKIATIHKAA